MTGQDWFHVIIGFILGVGFVVLWGPDLGLVICN